MLCNCSMLEVIQCWLDLLEKCTIYCNASQNHPLVIQMKIAIHCVKCGFPLKQRHFVIWMVATLHFTKCKAQRLLEICFTLGKTVIYYKALYSLCNKYHNISNDQSHIRIKWQTYKGVVNASVIFVMVNHKNNVVL